jgi:hypothetical protein
MYNWSVLVHHAATHHYRPGQEDTTLRVLSSERGDVGVFAVIHEPQYATAADRSQAARLPARLLAYLRAVAAPVRSGIAGRPRARPGDARR